MKSDNNPANNPDKRDKREHGTGGVYYLKDRDRWMAKITVNHKQITKTFKTEKEAKAHLKNLIKNQKDLVNEYKKESFKSYILNWLENYKNNGLKQRSYDSLEWDINNYVLPYIGHMPLLQITTDDVQGMVNKLFEDGRSKSTMKRSLSAVNSCMKHALGKGDIPRNPCFNITIPKEERYEQLKPKEIFVMDDDLIKTYIKEAKRTYPNGTPIYRMSWGCILILFTGIRKAEAIALRWSDIDFNKKEMYIKNSYATVVNRDEAIPTKTVRVEQHSTKTKSGQRTIPLNKNALEALENLKKLNGMHEYVLSSRKGTPQGETSLLRTHKCICKQIGIDCSLHSLRHTFGSQLIKNNVDIKTVQQILGHSRIETTYQIYIHVYPDMKQKAVKAIEFDFDD